MKFDKLVISILLSAGSVLNAQSFSSSASNSFESEPEGEHAAIIPAAPYSVPSVRPFSTVAFGVGASPLGIQLTSTTNLTPHLNLRASGNFFNYSTTFTTSGITANSKLDLKSAGAAVDIYPFHKGFRISPGVLFFNNNGLTASANVPGGMSFTLNDQTYYSADANARTGATPITGNAVLNLHTTNPAFTITSGWGNTLPQHGHWSFPFEVGVALTGAPSLNVNLGGWACYDNAQTLCTDITSKTDPIALQIQSNLHAQVAKWTKDMEPLKTYPIASFGVAYSFGTRSR